MPKYKSFYDQPKAGATRSMIEINRSTFEQIDNWADRTIEQFKSAMKNEKTYLRWSDRRLYNTQDTWIDENWWYQTAEYLFNKQDKMFPIPCIAPPPLGKEI